MGKITVETCEIEGLKVITPKVFEDKRGYFMETYNYNDFKEVSLKYLFRTISPLHQRVFSEAFISRRSSLRTSL